jgi:MbtH protein
MNSSPDPVVYTVVANDEDQYSVWCVDCPLPPGWREVGYRAARAECLEHIQRVWTDLRPRSLRSASAS